MLAGPLHGPAGKQLTFVGAARPGTGLPPRSGGPEVGMVFEDPLTAWGEQAERKRKQGRAGDHQLGLNRRCLMSASNSITSRARSAIKSIHFGASTYLTTSSNRRNFATVR